MLQISLRQEDGTTKTFKQDFISGRMFRRTVEIQKLMKEQGGEPETLTEVYGFFSEVFGNQFSPEEFEDGIDSRKMIDTILKYINSIIGRASDALGSTGTENPN